MNYENPPFPRGGTGTYYSDPSTIDSNAGAQLEGSEWLFADKLWVPGTGLQEASDRTGGLVRVRVVRNKSGAAILPRRLCAMKVNGTTQGAGLGQVSGYLTTVGAEGYPADEFLPAAGVADGDLFYVVVKGPALITLDSAGAHNLAIGGVVVPSGTAGKVVTQDTTQTGANMFAQIQGAIGRSLDASNVAGDVDVCINVGAVRG